MDQMNIVLVEFWLPQATGAQGVRSLKEDKREGEFFRDFGRNLRD